MKYISILLLLASLLFGQNFKAIQNTYVYSDTLNLSDKNMNIAKGNIIEGELVGSYIKISTLIYTEYVKAKYFKELIDNNKYWLNTKSHKRHNKSCRWYGNTKKGYYMSKAIGSACGTCGGIP